MTLKKIDYSNTIIYKIVCNDLSVTDCYVGNTTQFRQRKSQHKRTCINSNSKSYNFPLYKFIREHSGWENFSMIEIEKFPCTDGNESRARERYYYELLNAKLNKLRPLTSEEEKKEQSKEYQKTEKYKEKKTLRSKEYNKENKEKIKLYYKENREKILKNVQVYNENNKDKIKEIRAEKITCICGSLIAKMHKARHEKSFKHISKSQSLFKPTDEIIHA